MATATISSKYQVVIPKEVREQVSLKPGQRVSVIVIDGIIHLVPVPSLDELEGFVKGIDTSNYREEVDRL